MKILRFLVLLFLTIPICSLAALGDDDELSFYELEEELMRTVTIATGVKQSIARAPAVTSIITAKDIENIGASNLSEALNTIPGFFTSYNRAGYLVFTMRGISSTGNPEVLLLLNGIRMNHSDTGRGGGLSMPALNVISRIEIIRGPGSAVYGADAFAGVVNVITKTADDIQGTEVGMKIGNLDTQNAWVSHGSIWNGFKIMTSLEYDNTDGSGGIVDSDKQTILDHNFGTNASVTPSNFDISRHGYDARIDIQKENWLIRAGYRDMNTGNAANGTEALSNRSENILRRFNAELIYHNPTFTEYWDVTAQLSYLQMNVDNNLVLFPPGAFGGTYPDGMKLNLRYYERHPRFDLSGFYSKFDKHLIRVGTGYIIDDQYEIGTVNNFGGGTMKDFSDTPDASAPEIDRNNWYVFLQDSWQISSEWELTSGIRYDEYSDFGNTINPRVALVWQSKSNFTTKLLFGRAFRSPTFDELYINNSVTQMGNPNLEPETIETWELAFNYRPTKKLNFDLNLFHYDITDKILYTLSDLNLTEAMFTAQNTGNWTGHGLEFETRWKVNPRINLLFNYAFQNGEDDITNQELGNSPEHQAYLRTDWLLIPKLFLNTQINWTGDWSRQPNDPRKKIDNSTIVSLNLRYKEVDKWSVAVGVRNLFDEDVRIPSLGPDSDGNISMPNDYPLHKRSYWLELKYNF
ncbi:MAG: TonB-dependent receptor [Candidatus Marithrix sp.]